MFTKGFVFTHGQRKYELLELLSEGGMAQVFRVKSNSTSKELVGKILQPEKYHELADYFEKEGELMRGLDHLGIPKLVDHFEFQYSPSNVSYMIVIEYAEGKSLEKVLEESANKKKSAKGLPESEVLIATGSLRKHKLLEGKSWIKNGS